MTHLEYSHDSQCQNQLTFWSPLEGSVSHIRSRLVSTESAEWPSEQVRVVTAKRSYIDVCTEPAPSDDEIDGPQTLGNLHILWRP